MGFLPKKLMSMQAIMSFNGFLYFKPLMGHIILQTFVYGDLYRYDIEKNEWKLISSPNSPPPRSAHQAVAWKDNMFIFGMYFMIPLNFYSSMEIYSIS